jgi:CO/xanthine dehydrogenase Mo-binding subunit
LGSESLSSDEEVLGLSKPKFSSHSFAAHFVEVSWQPEIARLRVNRVLSVIDAGRIINKRTGSNQIEGAVVMGIGMAVFEHTQYDHRNGAPINSNLAITFLPPMPMRQKYKSSFWTLQILASMPMERVELAR